MQYKQAKLHTYVIKAMQHSLQILRKRNFEALLVSSLRTRSPEKWANCRLLHYVRPVQARQVAESIRTVNNGVGWRGGGIAKNKVGV